MPLSSQTRVVIADDHEILLERVLLVLRRFQVIGKVNNGRDLVDEALRLRPDVIVSDITMPILNGIEAAHKLREAGSASRFIFFTVHDQPAFLRACFAEGALGYVTKSRLSLDLIPAINEALSGRSFISPSIPR
jgi:DNA-binding NarL/FixJ family response regulator